LDALAAARDSERLEREAPLFLARRSYLQPFALRALGVVREDEEMIEQAQAVFESMGLDWFANS
jgi:hypothetical protein